mmetsp:Transcript_24516/g.68895  ORF Transcript_24516/g.68895 Transcript_24516/m.68895 type:complete len:203 (+) Transcript_24516:2467-3075(+)
MPGVVGTSTGGASSCRNGCSSSLPSPGPRKYRTISLCFTNCPSHVSAATSVSAGASSSKASPERCSMLAVRLSMLVPSSAAAMGSSDVASSVKQPSSFLRLGALPPSSSAETAASQTCAEPSSPRSPPMISGGGISKRPSSSSCLASAKAFSKRPASGAASTTAKPLCASERITASAKIIGFFAASMRASHFMAFFVSAIAA